MRQLWGEPERDPGLGEALRRIEAARQPGDAEMLRRRIMAAARPRLAGLGPAVPQWWEWVSRWTRVLVPAGLAAVLAAGLLVRGSGTAADSGLAATDAGSDSTLVLAAFSEPPSRGLVAAYLIAPEGNDWLLEQAVNR